MMDNNEESAIGTDAHPTEHVRTGADVFGEWLTVKEAVAYCVTHGLSRTPKTVRKWAQEAHKAEGGEGDITVKHQDTGNGFRWLIERESLDVKIRQEREFEERSPEVRTGAHPSEPVATGAHMSALVPTGAADEERQNEGMIEFLKAQINEKDHQINSLLERDQETNYLIRGLQEMMFGLQPPKETPPPGAGDNSGPHAVEDQVEYRDGAG